MTRYHFDNQEKKKKLSRTKITVVTLVVVVFVLLVVFVIAPLIKDIARGPQWLRDATALSVQNDTTALSSKKTLIAEIDQLKAKDQNDEAQLLKLQMLQDENTTLRTELSYLPNPSSTILAQVLAKPSQSLYNSLVIDRGSNNGVSVGQLVTTEGTIGLGTVASVTAYTSTIQLFSGPQFSGSLVMKNQKITVPAIGKGGGNFEIHIPQDIAVSTGDLLAFPTSPNVAVGVIESIISDPRNPFQTVLARVPVNIQELEFVEVVK